MIVPEVFLFTHSTISLNFNHASRFDLATNL